MDVPAKVSWRDPRIRTGASGVEGDGEFALETIREGERLKVLGGKLITDADLRGIVESGERFSALRVGEDTLNGKSSE